MYMNKMSVNVTRVGVNFGVIVDGQLHYVFSNEDAAYKYVEENL